jgi:antitoxin component YwqK of YwqJK toxin-antitoxin module
MKLLNTLITILFISLLSFPSWSATMDDLVYRGGIYYQKFTDVPFTGEMTGQIQGSFKNGKREGAWVGYWDNGQLYRKGNWKNGKEEGVWVSYNQDGTINTGYTGTYKNGKKISD